MKELFVKRDGVYFYIVSSVSDSRLTLGYLVYAAPDIKKSNLISLCKGMTFNIEPSIYFAGKILNFQELWSFVTSYSI